jgi:hypothetical protein
MSNNKNDNNVFFLNKEQPTPQQQTQHQSTQQYQPPQMKTIKRVSKIGSTVNTTNTSPEPVPFKITIHSNEHARPEFYNDYIVKLKESVKHVNTILLENYKFPFQNYNINEQYNQFVVRIHDEDHCSELNYGDYTLTELLDTIQEGLRQIDSDLEIKLTNRRVEISHKNKKPFELKALDQSIYKILGFTQPNYKGEFKYVAEIEPNLDYTKTLLIFIKEFNEVDPFIIEQNNLRVLSKKCNVSNIDTLTIQIQNVFGDLYDFVNESHTIHLNLVSYY